jgi:tetratricopeptide (TPR) repeat protein
VLKEQRVFPEALKAFEEARGIYQDLAAAEPHIYRPYVAATLNNLGNMLGVRREFPEARKACEAARDIYQELAAAEPHIYRPQVAMTLSSLGNILGDQHEFPAAREAHEGARHIYEELAAAEPQVYRLHVAMTLNNLGTVLWQQRAFVEAREACEEARDIYQELVATEPLIFRSHVATTLSNLGNVFREQRAFPEARKACEEARDIYQELASAEPHVYRPEVARTLSNLGIVLSAQRAFPEARKACAEALVIRQDLAATEPQIYRPAVAASLLHLGNVLKEQRAFPEALRAFEEARDIYEELAATEPHIYRPELAAALNNLGNVLFEQRVFLEAQEAFEEARDIHEEFAATEPHIYEPYLAGTLNNLGNVLSAQRAFAEAQRTYEAALGIYEQLAAAEPSIYRPYMAATFNNLGHVLQERGLNSEALDVAKKSVMAAEDPVIPEAQRHLTKGQVRGAYSAVLSDMARRADTDPDRMFRHLAAVRAGDARATGEDPEGGLAAAVQTLRDTEERLGHDLSVLIVQDLSGGTLFAVLSTREPCLRWECADEFGAGLGPLASAFEQWSNALFVGATSRASGLAGMVGDAAAIAWVALPGFIQETLQPAQVGPAGEVLVSPDNPWGSFPFEILRYGNGAGDYLGLARPLPRVAGIHALAIARLAAGDSGDGNAEALVVANPQVADPQRTLPSAALEGERVGSLLEGEGFQVTSMGGTFSTAATVLNVLDALGRSPDMVHYTGHGTVVDAHHLFTPVADRRGHGEEALCLADGFLGTWTLRDWGGRLDGAVVILSSCMTGRTRAFGGVREDLAGEFLRLGAEAVIASAFPISDWLGAFFGVALHAANGDDVQTRFVKARRVIEYMARTQRPHLWPSWALLTLHGNPFARWPGNASLDESALTAALDKFGKDLGMTARDLRKLLE